MMNRFVVVADRHLVAARTAPSPGPVRHCYFLSIMFWLIAVFFIFFVHILCLFDTRYCLVHNFQLLFSWTHYYHTHLTFFFFFMLRLSSLCVTSFVLLFFFPISFCCLFFDSLFILFFRSLFIVFFVPSFPIMYILFICVSHVHVHIHFLPGW